MISPLTFLITNQIFIKDEPISNCLLAPIIISSDEEDEVVTKKPQKVAAIKTSFIKKVKSEQ